jgi:hypothetical protein
MKPAGGDRTYKRSWKNLLINKRYQLSFTLFMVGLTTVLMTGLGIWIYFVAKETTKVSKISVRGTPCPKIPTMEEPEEPPDVPMHLPAEGEGSDAEPTNGSNAGSGSGSAEQPRRKIDVTLDEMQIPPGARPVKPVKPVKPVLVVPPDLGKKIVEHWTCELEISARVEKLERGRIRILLVLIGTGLLLVFGLAAYGIKMTHRVAGPLFKVQLYLAKMRDGRLDKVYNLRKGDQLVDFYNHFKLAHGGVVKLEQGDIDRLKAVIAAAERAGAGEHASIVELREMLARKEKSIE